MVGELMSLLPVGERGTNSSAVSNMCSFRFNNQIIIQRTARTINPFRANTWTIFSDVLGHRAVCYFVDNARPYSYVGNP